MSVINPLERKLAKHTSVQYNFVQFSVATGSSQAQGSKEVHIREKYSVRIKALSLGRVDHRFCWLIIGEFWHAQTMKQR